MCGAHTPVRVTGYVQKIVPQVRVRSLDANLGAGKKTRDHRRPVGTPRTKAPTQTYFAGAGCGVGVCVDGAGVPKFTFGTSRDPSAALK
jgi:hypothetical protein